MATHFPALGLRLDPPVTHASRVLFVRPEVRERMCEAAERARALVARPGLALPGGLMRVLDVAIEGALARRGAMPSVALPDSEPRHLVADQIFRAVTLPTRGLLICMPSLHALAEAGRLREDDARAALAWIEAARSEMRLALTVLLDADDQRVELRVPRSLAEIVGGEVVDAFEDIARSLRPDSDTPKPPKVAPTMRPPGASEPPQAGSEARSHDHAPCIPDLSVPPLPQLSFAEEFEQLPSLEATVEALDTAGDQGEEAEARVEVELEAELLAQVSAGDELDAAAAEPVAEDFASFGEQEREAQLAEAAELAETEVAAAEAAAEAAQRFAREQEADRQAEAARIEARREAERQEAERAERLMNQATWRTHALELDAAKGPRPAAQIEKLFIERYLPLLGAVATGQMDHSTRELVRSWRDSFCESYESAFTAIRVTGKRPTMVMDAPEVAHRIARLASARSVKLVLIDGMSFDLAGRVSARLGRALDKRALLVEKNVLWAALPSTTNVQLHLLGKGTPGFADIPQPVSESEIPRGRSVGSFRRERLGGRELLRLDIIETRLRTAKLSYDDCLDSLADEICESLFKLFEAMPPRTLVYLFGDHGFSVYGSSRASHGGASPEEVLVAGHAWLTDAVQ